ncbi:uncharacterized protein LOC129295917, partial [Prosopis cineraria]|uniref:uncharacterized protein LOC129295917 n=1 Tax=Prosopis cineraria TaxID=364024 RepID=UPI00240FC1E1
MGLCNGTRLIVTRIGKHVIEAQEMSESTTGMKVCIPRIAMCSSDFRFPFTLKRRQFPIMLAFAMTINKSQGQSLCNVGLYLPRPVFTHGQLYVVVSRVRSRKAMPNCESDNGGSHDNMEEKSSDDGAKNSVEYSDSGFDNNGGDNGFLLSE